MNKISLHDALSLENFAERIRVANPRRAGLKLQNNNDTAKIFYRSGGKGHEKSFLCLQPGMGAVDDLHAPNQDLWAYSDVAGAVLTLVEDFN